MLGHRTSLVAQMVKNLPTMWETWVNPWVRKIPWRRAWQPTPIFLPGESHGQRSLEGYRPWGCKELDTAEWLSTAQGLTTLGCLQSILEAPADFFSSGLLHLLCSVRNVLNFIFKYMNISSFPFVAKDFFFFFFLVMLFNTEQAWKTISSTGVW